MRGTIVSPSGEVRITIRARGRWRLEAREVVRAGRGYDALYDAMREVAQLLDSRRLGVSAHELRHLADQMDAP